MFCKVKISFINNVLSILSVHGSTKGWQPPNLQALGLGSWQQNKNLWGESLDLSYGLSYMVFYNF
jgi:hypothetical protein